MKLFPRICITPYTFFYLGDYADVSKGIDHHLLDAEYVIVIEGGATGLFYAFFHLEIKNEIKCGKKMFRIFC